MLLVQLYSLLCLFTLIGLCICVIRKQLRQTLWSFQRSFTALQSAFSSLPRKIDLRLSKNNLEYRIISSRYHIIGNHSPNVQKFGNQLDYLGIVILMWGSTIPSVYYGFYCDTGLQKAYWTNVSSHHSTRLCLLVRISH